MGELSALHIFITGRVQGVGFRPFVSRLAHEFGLSGWVRNHSGQVEILVEGTAKALTAFKIALINQAPPLSQPESPKIIPVTPSGVSGFTIVGSKIGHNNSDVHIPPDYFVCDDCLDEMQNPEERRYRYPFINCTQCGPRYTLIDYLPYDRPNTAMADFKLCDDCKAEYSDPVDRRYHAQPLACFSCGPRLTFRRHGYPDLCSNETALTACLDGLREGLIIAVKGVGGYHLLCDATNPRAVLRLRERKVRPDKPLAVLVPWLGEDGLDLANQLADLDVPEKQLLRSPLRPIVLARKSMNSILSQAIAPDLGLVGLMLPYSPLHHLLANGFGLPLVATSANLSGEPVLTDEDEVERLSHVADAFMHHNRPIRRPADDSVYRQVAGKVRPVRLGRGLAPIERRLPFWLEQPLLAVGADLKNTVALGFRDRVVISPHIGDLGSLRSADVFERVIGDFLRLYGISPQAIVCDAHPGYHSSRWAKNQDLPTIPVFHHHAHASALAGEHELEGQLLVFTWDGTGYGEDGSIWGGETLLGSPGNWHRVGSLRPFYLPGGDKASREHWRCALSICWEYGLEWPDCPQDIRLLRRAWEQRINCPATSSVGRLFDAAAALIGVAHYSTYEGHAAMRLEAISTPGAEAIPLPLIQNTAGVLVSDWGALLPFLMRTEVSPLERGSVFHSSLASAIATQAKALREKYGVTRVGLSGGVFQNRLLTELALSKLSKLGFDVYLHEGIPSGDGGISFGQVIEAGSKMSEAVLT